MSLSPHTKFIGNTSVSVGSSSTQILPTRSWAAKRSFVKIFNTSATVPVYISCGQAATLTNGGLLPAGIGQYIQIDNFNGSIFGITASSATVTVLEGFLNALGYPNISSSSSMSSASSLSSLSSSSSTKQSLSTGSSSSSTKASLSSSRSSHPWKP